MNICIILYICVSKVENFLLITNANANKLNIYEVILSKIVYGIAAS